MKLGVFTYNDDFVMHPAPLAKALEERGFESLWIGEHTHIPASRKTPYPLGGELPKEYIHMMDPFVSLGAAAAVTERLKLGTGICLVIERDVITLAKEVATLDVISGGRVLFGIGGGWNQEEMENHGTPFEHRFAVLREKVEALKALWTEAEASYHGKYVSFDPVWSYPKPLQKPHPPVLAGFFSELGKKRVVRYCDGWMPLQDMVDDIPGAFAGLRKQMEEAGRDPASLDLSIWTTPGVDPSVERLDELKTAGVERVVLFAPVAGEDVILPFLDRYAELIPKLA
ncbi:MAG: LLM class F420-dependent oxidoreductase [Myxococcales bacterium]|nr:LLM class F420-dependent oxidoreductase [Myxococcales bacterium]